MEPLYEVERTLDAFGYDPRKVDGEDRGWLGRRRLGGRPGLNSHLSPHQNWLFMALGIEVFEFKLRSSISTPITGRDQNASASRLAFFQLSTTVVLHPLPLERSSSS